MNIAKLNKRITIQKASFIQDDIGNEIVEWTDFYSCYASVDTRGRIDSEKEVARMMVDHSNVNFTIRYTQKLRDLTTQEYRVLMDGDIYDIKAVDWMNYRKKSIKLITKKVER